MLTPSLNTVMTRLLIVAAVLATLMLFAPALFAQTSEGEPIQYDENATSTVRVFMSNDPEDATDHLGRYGSLTPTTLQSTTTGELMFVSPPDYENPTDRGLNTTLSSDDDLDFDDHYTS